VKDRISGEVRSVTLVRRRIQIPPVRARMLDSGTGYLRIVNFQQSTAREVRQALGTVMPKGPAQLKGLIIDLRNNPGGLFDQAIDVADILLSSGRITLLRSQDRRFNRTFNASGRGLVPGLPVVVLINRGTASAAEILAGALQGKPGVLIMGQRSFGKASVQAVYHLRDGLALRITTAHYFTAEGHDINRRGIHPDQVLREPDETDINTGQTYSTLDDSVRIDPEVHAALEYLGLR
jgi:carboxyl-terminal processing protease